MRFRCFAHSVANATSLLTQEDKRLGKKGEEMSSKNAGCAYCKCLEYQENEGTEVCIDDYFLVVSHECSSCRIYTEKKFVINYCPYCGRKL